MEFLNLSTIEGLILLALISASAGLFVFMLVKKKDFNRVSSMLFFCGIIHIGWWIICDPVYWYRHLFPGLFIFVIGLTLIHYDFTQKMPSLFRISIAILTIFSCLFIFRNHAFYTTLSIDGFSFEQTRKLSYQRKVAAEVSKLASEGYVFYGYGWFQSPQISYLSKVPFYSTDDKNYARLLIEHPGLLVLDTEMVEIEIALSKYCDFNLEELRRPGLAEEKPYILSYCL